MDAFESVVEMLLRREGYWTATSFKVKLTPSEKRRIKKSTTPRREIDLVAYSGGRNEILAVECKSFLDSTGVTFRNGAFEPEHRYKLFTDATLRRTVLARLKRQLIDAQACGKNPSITLCLATGKIAGKTRNLKEHFARKGWRLFDTDWLCEKLRAAADADYENDVAHVVAKMICRNESSKTATSPGETMKTLLVRTLDQWRGWLTEHHASESEVWLIFHKRHTGAKSIDYKDALDEALCFGWVDSLVKRLDDRRYARKFTPRRADSRWSAVNRKRYAELKARGRLKPPGIQRPPTNRGYGPRPSRLAIPSKLPEYIQAALRNNPIALRHFEALAPSERRRYFAWIESAKREETKLRRLKEAIRLLASGKVLGLK